MPVESCNMTNTFWTHNPAVTLSAVPQKYIGDQPTSDRWADALYCGDYTHPTTGVKFSISGDDLDELAVNFSRMNADGVTIPIVNDHRETVDATRGYVIGARREGNKLMVLHRFVGADALRDAARNKVSLKLHRQYRDAKGKTYGQCFTHSSLTPVPVVSGQQGFFAASRGAAAGASTDIFILSAAAGVGTHPAIEQILKDHQVSGLPSDDQISSLSRALKRTLRDHADCQNSPTRDDEKLRELSTHKRNMHSALFVALQKRSDAGHPVSAERAAYLSRLDPMDPETTSPPAKEDEVTLFRRRMHLPVK